ncbi:Aste57867_14280 [Aphanomyces stellatus]|uniref:Aste57867_14280 protein n=1 Tax=Aphanomyces stellatus TaxID=120398 RepID=A0A485L087_9STRA|nr:hypothetical protein As57867_014228 [Aphanomyces stellatus]VFT91105.1 Aste57867_14280 [Aphanomyces stellatus]
MNRRRWTRPTKTVATTPSTPTAKDMTSTAMMAATRKTKDRGIFKLHVHGLEFQGGEELVLNHDAIKQELAFPDGDAHVMEIYTPNDPEDSRHHLLVDLPTPDELKAKKPVKGKMQLSLLKDTAAQFGLQVLQDVVVRFVEKQAVEVDFVEVSLKDQFLSRRDLWYLQHALVGKALYVGKMVRLHGARLHVMELVHENENVVTGVVTARTRFVFRSKSSRVFWLVQISPELWDMGNNGDLYADELIRMVKTLFDRWQSDYVSHGLTIILFARNFYDELPPIHTPYHSNAICKDEDDDLWYEDFYKAISYGEDGAAVDMASMLVTLKAEVNAFPHLCGWDIDVTDDNLPRLRCKGRRGHPSSAANGNVLESINLILNIYEKHYLDRDLNRSGQNLVLFTAGNGVFRVNRLLSDMTEQRMMDHGIGFDCISLSSPPLEPVPRFFLKGSAAPSLATLTRASSLKKPPPPPFPSALCPSPSLFADDAPSSSLHDPTQFTPVWFSVRFSQHSGQNSAGGSTGFTPLPLCRLFGPPVGTPSYPLAFLLTQFEWHNQSLHRVVTGGGGLAPPPPATPHPSDLELHLHRLKPHVFADDYDDDVFSMRVFVEKSPLVQCGTPPMPALLPPKRRMKSFALSPELKAGGGLRSPMHHLALPPQARSFPSPSSPRHLVPSPNRPTLMGHGMLGNGGILTHHARQNSNNLNNYAPSSHSNKRRWSQVYRYEPLGYELDFKSLCTPALLPLTTDYIPLPHDLKHNFEESFYTVLLPDHNEGSSMFTNHVELVQEMVAQRFSQDFQLIEEQTSDDLTMYKLSMGHRIHEITYVESRQEIVVKKFQQIQGLSNSLDLFGSPKVGMNTTPPRVAYHYSLWSPLTSSFLAAKQDFRYAHKGEYGWNYLDNLICGHNDDMLDNIKYKRGLYCVLPPPTTVCLDVAERQKVVDDYIDKFNRLLEFIRAKAKGMEDNAPFDVKLVADLKSSAGGRRVRKRNVKIPLSAPDAPLQQQWLNVNYDDEMLPVQVFHLEIQWLVCRSSLVDDFITGLTRRAKQSNLDVIPMPENCGASTMDVHPLICPVFFPLKSPMEFAFIERKLLSDLHFCLEGIHPIPNDLLTYQYMGATGGGAATSQLGNGAMPPTGKVRPTRKTTVERTYRQFIHRSLSCFVRLTDGGVIWISSRRMHSPEMQILFCHLQHAMHTLALLDELKKCRAFQVGMAKQPVSSVDPTSVVEPSMSSDMPPVSDFSLLAPAV